MAINIRRICRSGIAIIAILVTSLNASAQRQKIANLELTPDSTAGWTIYTDTTGAQQYFTWDSVLYDIYQIDTLGSAGDIGQVGFFTSSDGTDFNSATYQAIDWTDIEVNDTFVVSGSQVELITAGKYRLFTNVNLEFASTDFNSVQVRIRKNGSTILPAGSDSYIRTGGNDPLSIVVESFDNAGTIGDYYEVVLRTTGAITEPLNLIDTNTTFIISTVAGGSGPQGPAGTDGVDGTDGVSVDSAYVNTDSLFVLLSNGDLDGGWYVKGDKGDPGNDGQDGNVLDSNDLYLDTIIQQNDSVYDFEIRNRYGNVLEKTLSLTVSQPPDADPQVLSTSSIAGGGRTTLDQGGGSFDIVGGTNSTVSITGSIYSISSINNFANSLSFNTGTGQLTIGRNGLSALSTSLDGRYATTSGLPWTDEGTFLRPTNSTDDVVIGASTQGTYASELEVDGTQTIYGSTGDQNLFAIVDGSNNYRHRLGYNTASNYSVHRQRNNFTDWYTGVNNDGDYYISDGLPTSNQPFVIDGTGDIILNDYPSIRDDVVIAPSNFLFTNASGVVQSSPVGVYPITVTENSDFTADKRDYLIRAFANISDLTITLPEDPPEGKTYIISYADASTNRVSVTATGTTTVDGSATRVLDQSSAGYKGLAIFVYDGAGDYIKFHQSID